jgi:hypothetical protein
LERGEREKENTDDLANKKAAQSRVAQLLFFVFVF